MRCRSTTSKRPQPKIEPNSEYSDQKYSFTKNSKVKSPSRDGFENPVQQYHVNITHSSEPRNRNDLSVKSLESFHKEQTQEVDDDDIEYEEYEDDDYGVILTEQDRAIKEKPTTRAAEPTTTIPVTLSTAAATTTSKPEDNTVIIFENFILPNKNENQENLEDEGELEYEYVDEEEEDEIKTTEKPITSTTPAFDEKTTTADNLEVTTYRNHNRIQAVVSVVTSKTVVNGTMMHDEEPETIEETTTEEENYPSSTKPTPRKSTTEDYYVVASVQTSRSVSGAHFLPFEHVEQKEKKKSRVELSHKKLLADHENNTEEPEARTTQVTETENVSSEIQDDDDYHIFHESTTTGVNDEFVTTIATTAKYAPLPSTESIIDKLDRVQSDLSLGVLSGEYPVLKDRSSKKNKSQSVKSPSEAPGVVVEVVEVEDENDEQPEIKSETPIPTTVKPLVLIRKFSPKSNPATTQRTTTTQKVVVKQSVSSTTTEEPIITTTQDTTLPESQRENKKIAFDVIAQDDLVGLLPAGYKPRNSFKNKKLFSSTTQQTTTEKDKDDQVPTKSRNSTISRSYKSQSNSQNLNSPLFKGFKNKDKPTGSKPAEENETENVPKKTFNKFSAAPTDDDAIIDIKKFLPPDFKPVNETDQLAVIPLEELSKFLPPGFKLEPSSTELPKIKILDEEISKFLPPGYKPPAEKEEKKVDDVLSSILGKIKFQEASDLLPADFEQAVKETPVYRAPTTEVPTTTKATPGKVVFPSRLGKKPGAGRSTTPEPVHAKGPKAPELEIRRGPPTRATTEFTGWPSKATTPISIERLLELQKNAMEINIADLLPKSTTPEPTTTTTTTTTTTPRPTQPTVCRSECSLAATIRIIDGVEWSPELLTHYTDEYKNLAAELEIELNEVYSNAPSLKQWFKKVRIDSFSKGSVLVDYFVELADIPKDINTLEIKSMFHEALSPAPQRSEPQEDEEEGVAQPIVKEAFKLGNFLVDPISTDFIGNLLILRNDQRFNFFIIHLQSFKEWRRLQQTWMMKAIFYLNGP